jgi:hypothetical protein
LDVRPYRTDRADAWNAFNAQAANGHFLFDRGFMDYHADRFRDASLIVEADDAPIALLPLNRSGDQAFSHQGLTFGGLIHAGLGTAEAMQALDLAAAHLRSAGMTKLTYKALPWIYARAPAQQDLYWLFRRDARLVRRDVSVAIDNRSRGRVSSRRDRGRRKAQKAGLSFGRSSDWRSYWRILEGVLEGRHGATPVHTVAEIELLASRFPGRIELHAATYRSEMLAGVAMFLSDHVAHAQYIAAAEAGRETGALDGLFENLIGRYAATHRYFDFGISNTEQGRVLNEGLIRQKEEFGASALAHDTYEVSL